MHSWKIALSVCGCLVMAACGDESAARKAVKETLKDPGSAKFGEATFVQNAKGESYGCLTVNAKNSMGGYVGDKQALVMKSGDKWIVAATAEIPHPFSHRRIYAARCLSPTHLSPIPKTEALPGGAPCLSFVICNLHNKSPTPPSGS